jgi:hypothetical protein
VAVAFGVVGGQAAAGVGVQLVGASVAHLHPVAALAADEKPLQKRGAVAHRAPLLGTSTVGGQPPEIRLVVLQGDVGGEALFDEGVPPPPIEYHATGGGLSRTFFAGIYLPLAVGVNPGVDGVFEHVLQRHPVGLAPL